MKKAELIISAVIIFIVIQMGMKMLQGQEERVLSGNHRMIVSDAGFQIREALNAPDMCTKNFRGLETNSPTGAIQSIKKAIPDGQGRMRLEYIIPVGKDSFGDRGRENRIYLNSYSLKKGQHQKVILHYDLIGQLPSGEKKYQGEITLYTRNIDGKIDTCRLSPPPSERQNIWQVEDHSLIFNHEHLGIGTKPETNLDIVGVIKPGAMPKNWDCDRPKNGTLLFRNQYLLLCDGKKWIIIN